MTTDLTEMIRHYQRMLAVERRATPPGSPERRLRLEQIRVLRYFRARARARAAGTVTW